MSIEILDSKQDANDGPKKLIFTYPLVTETDMSEEMKCETVELCVIACEKFGSDNEGAAQMIKETMDTKYGLSWHVVVGEGFGLKVTHQVNSLLYMYYAGNVAICVWKCI